MLPQPPSPLGASAESDDGAAAATTIAVASGATMVLRSVSTDPVVVAVANFVSADEARYLTNLGRAGLEPSRVAAQAQAQDAPTAVACEPAVAGDSVGAGDAPDVTDATGAARSMDGAGAGDGERTVGIETGPQEQGGHHRPSGVAGAHHRDARR